MTTPQQRPPRRPNAPTPRTTQTRNSRTGGAQTRPSQRNSAPQKRSLSFKILAALIALLLLVLVGIGACSLFGGDSDTSASDSSASAGATSVDAPEKQGAKKTEAGNLAIAHERSAEERRATSTSANDVKPGPKTVYLTFDDGPSTNTHRILEILDSYGVKATWFVKGDQPQLEYVKDIWDAGNQVAIHTYTHDYKQVYASADAYWSDLHEAGAAIEDYLGFEPTLVRFPGGSHNSFNGGIVDEITDRMARENYHYFDWNVSSGDGGDHDAQFIADYALDQAEGCHSCCVLMHDSAAKDTTVEALPTIIEWFIDNDFEFDVLLADSYGYHF